MTDQYPKMESGNTNVFSIGGTLGDAFRKMGANAVHDLLVLALAVLLPSFLISFLGYMTGAGEEILPSQSIGVIISQMSSVWAAIGVLVLYFISIILSLFASAMIMLRALGAHLAPSVPANISQMGRAMRLVAPFFGIQFVYNLAGGIGLLLLIVPGLMLLTSWMVALPARASGYGTGVFDAIEVSANTTRGNRWKVFGLLLIMVLLFCLLLVLMVIPMALATMQMPEDGLIFMLINAAFETMAEVLTAWFGAYILVAAWLNLRLAKYGPDTQELEDVFA